MKKPKLGRYIIKACIIAVFMFVVTFKVTVDIVDMMHSNNSQMYYSQIEDTKERVAREQLMSADPEMIMKEGLKSEEYGIGLATVDFNNKIHSGAGLISMLYDSEGNVISGPSKAVFFKVYKKNDNGEDEVVRLETEYNDEWKKLFDAVENAAYDEKIGENNSGLPKDVSFGEFMEGGEYIEAFDITMDSQIVIDEIYVKGGYFIPGKVHVRVSLTSNNENVTIYSKDVLNMDMTPDNVSDYTKITMDDDGDEGRLYYRYDDVSPWAWGIEANDPGFEKYDYVMKRIEREDFSIERMIKDSSLRESGYFDKEFLHHFYWDARTINANRDIDGPEYVLVSLWDDSVLDAFYTGVDEEVVEPIKKIWIPAGMLTLFIFLLVASFIGGLRYMKAKSVYDMKCYRIETTNAMAHDLKTPLTAISGYAENLLEQVQVDKREYYAKSIITNVEYMDQMIHDILELSKSEDERQTVNLERIEVKEFIEEELKNFAHVIEERGLDVTLTGKTAVKTDPKMFKSLIDNLISNAVKYSIEGSEINIAIGEAVSADNRIKGLTGKSISITNRLSEPLNKTAKELVKPYVKGDNSRGSMKGSGVGLAIVENVARKLKYKVSYEITDDTFSVNVRM